MNEEFLKNIWDYLSSQELTTTPFDEWVINVQEDEGVQKNIHKYLTDQELTDSNFEKWLSNLGVKKKDETDMVSGLETGISQPSALSRNQRLSITPTAEKDTAIERAFGKNEVTDFFGDLYRAWKTGAGQAATVDDALKVFAGGTNVTDETLQDYIQAVQTMESFSPSEEMQDFSRIYEAEGKGVKGFIKGVLKNPTAAVQVAVSSLRSMINPASIAAGTAGAGAGATAGLAGGILAPITSTAGAGIGSILGMTGALETALSYTEFLKEELQNKGLDFTDENIRTVLENDESRNRIRNRSLGRGATISALNAITGGLAGGVAAKVGTKLGRTAGALSGLGTQAVGGGAAEAAGRAVAGQEMDVAEIGFEALGEIAGPSVIGTAIGVAKTPEYKINNEVVSRADIENIINSNDYDAITGITYEIVNDPVLKQKVNQARQDAPIAVEIKETFDKDKQPSDEQLKELVKLDKEITNTKGNKTPRARVKLKELEEQYKTISDVIQKPSTEEVDVQEPTPDSEAVGEGDTQQQPIAGETTPEQIETTTQPAEEIETQVETEESEIETYTLPEDPRKAKKDFEIIDNRNQKAGLEIDEEGNGKYYVRNIKTGSLVAVKTKNEAQVTKANPRSFDYGEGQPVLEEFRTQVEEEVVEDVQPATNKIGNFDVVIKDNKIVSITKEGKKPSSNSLSNVEKQIIETGLINVNPEEKIQTEGLSEVEFSNVVLDESNNATQIAEEIEFVQSKIKEQKQAGKDRTLNPLGVLFNIKFTPESYEAVTGNKVSEQSSNFRRTWIASKEKGGESLEDGWQVIFEEANLPVPAIEEVTDFINDFQTRGEFNKSLEVFSPELLTNLKNKFQELTGLNITETNIKRVADITAEQIQEIVSKEIFEAERRAEEKPIVSPERRKTPKPEKAEPRADITDDIKTLDESFNKITEEAVKTNLDNFASQIKSNLTKRGVLTEQARGTSTMRIDQAFGLNNSTKIYRTVIRPIIDVYNKFKSDYRRVNTDAEKAEDFIRYEGKSKTDKFLGRGRRQNDVTKDLYEIRLYQLAREYVSNIVDGVPSEKSPNPVELAQFTADEALAGRVLTDADGKALIELLKKHVKNGEINPDVMKRKLKPSQKKALKILDKRNAELEQKIIKNAQRSDKELDLINNYSHRVVLKSPLKQNVDVENEAKDFSENFEGVTEKERTEGVKPISFDPILSLLRGTQETNLSYYMKDEVGRIQALTSELFNKYKNGNKGQADASLALANSVRELLRITYVRTFMDASSTGLNLKREAEKMGYRVLLGSVPRFAAELLGNAAMLVTQPAEVIQNAYDKYSSISLNLKPTARDNYLKILENLNSAEVNKLGEIIGQADSKYSDPNNYLNLSEMRQSGMQSRVQEKMSIIAGMGARQTYKVVNSISDLLMAGGDKLIARPLWISKFANEFKNNVKNNLNEDVDLTVDEFEKIADGTSEYLKNSKYAKSIKDATFQSDKTVAEFITSGNPLNAIIKNVRRDEKGEAAKNFYRVINSFMANFNLNEYATARFAVGAMLKDGEISKAQAGKLLAGILARMSSYVILYRTFSKYFDEVFLGAPEEEEEEDVAQVITRQVIGSLSTLMFRGGLGNIPALPVNYGIEYLNKEYLDFLRDGGEYDAYDDSIVYSLIGLDDFAGKSLPEIALPILAGPYGPLAKTLTRGAELAGRTQSRKTQDARDRAQEELTNRISFELLGQLGLIPFYKDIRRGKLKIRFKDEKGNTISPSELRKLDPDLYDRLYN
tara:strand:+ start:718 stop:5988 length:5271 start_codon:yes stop_codon:yes gene_type:complete